MFPAQKALAARGRRRGVGAHRRPTARLIKAQCPGNGIHDQFVESLSAGAGSYAAAEAANRSPLRSVEQGLLNAVNAPTQALLERPLIGNGADGTAAGQVGGAGGLLYGNGGNGAAGAAGQRGGSETKRAPPAQVMWAPGWRSGRRGRSGRRRWHHTRRNERRHPGSSGSQGNPGGPGTNGQPG